MCRRKIIHYGGCNCRHQSGSTIFCRFARRVPNGLPQTPCDHVHDSVETRDERGTSICGGCTRQLREACGVVRQGWEGLSADNGDGTASGGGVVEQALGARGPPYTRAGEEFSWIDVHRALQCADTWGLLEGLGEGEGERAGGISSVAAEDNVAPVANENNDFGAGAEAGPSSRNGQRAAEVQSWIDNVSDEPSADVGRFNYGPVDPSLRGGINGHLWRQDARMQEGRRREAERLARERESRRNYYKAKGKGRDA
ncbi:hypothetical protein B0A55_08094 [Friedmanniomyces simplex]|uniref:Uncharacterized protein n=1 Tax=Friedmanniomyces simplex TaxID=329884 RepID=A0A4U0X8K4_9PEZI|nr:hypothetical protein B0A55_08094 [Friedmanniomyces simplex]